MIIETNMKYEEVTLSPVYRDGVAWTIVYDAGNKVYEFADEGIFTTPDAAFCKMQEMRASGAWTELSVVVIRAFNPVGTNAK